MSRCDVWNGLQSVMETCTVRRWWVETTTIFTVWVEPGLLNLDWSWIQCACKSGNINPSVNWSVLDLVWFWTRCSLDLWDLCEGVQLCDCDLSSKDQLLGEELGRTNDTVAELSSSLATEKQQRAVAESERNSLIVELVSVIFLQHGCCMHMHLCNAVAHLV